MTLGGQLVPLMLHHRPLHASVKCKVKLLRLDHLQVRVQTVQKSASTVAVTRSKLTSQLMHLRTLSTVD